MFLLRLIHLDSFKTGKKLKINYESKIIIKSPTNIPSKIINKDAINQIKNFSRKNKKSEPKLKQKLKSEIASRYI